MKKILIIGYYELKDYFLDIQKTFIDLKYQVSSYPLFQYAYDSNDKLDNYSEHLNNFIKKDKPDIILWWFIDIPLSICINIKNNNKNIFYILFVDDGACHLNNDILNKASLFNLIMVPTKENTLKYNYYSKVNNILYNPLGFNPDYFNNNLDMILDESDKYTADISMVCQNLLLDGDYFNGQYVEIKNLIDDIKIYSEKNNKVFKLYGNPILKNYYTDIYKGEIPYINLNTMLNKSKIFINTNPFYERSRYMNDLFATVMATNALMFIDNVKDIKKNFKTDCFIILDKKRYIEQINIILNDYNKYNYIVKNANEESKNYTWKLWVDKIHIEINKYFFNKEVYADIYDLNKNIDLWNHWLEEGKGKNYITFDLSEDVIGQFKHLDYAKNMCINSTNKKYLFWHWFMNSKNELYFNSNSSNAFIDFKENNITAEGFFEFCHFCNHKNLDSILAFSKKYPKADINKLLIYYIKMTES